MSTKAIRQLIEAGRAEVLPLDRVVREALAEVEALENAARTVAEQGIFEQETEDEDTRSAIDAAEHVFHLIAVETMS